MSSNNESDFYASLFRGPMDNVLDTLNMLNLIDVGLIVEVDGEGRALVQTSKTTSDIPVMLTNVEVIYPGNNHGAFTSSCAGCMGLIFAPRTVIPNVRKGEINATLPEYNINGIKVLPISNGRELAVNHCFDADGSLHIHTEKYSFNFDVDGFDFNTLAGMFLTVTKDNVVTLYRRNADSGILDFKLSNEGISSSFNNSENTSIYFFNLLDDGSLSLERIIPAESEDEEPKTHFKVESNAEGIKGTFNTSDDAISYDFNLLDGGGVMTFERLQPPENDDDDPVSLFKTEISDEGIKAAYTNKDGDSSYTMDMLDDGTLTLEHVQPSDDDPKSLNKVVIDKEGAVTITVGSDDPVVTISIDTDGNISVKSEGDVGIESKGNLSVKSEGDVGIEVSGDANIKTDGDANIESSGAISIKSSGDTSVEASGDLTLKGSNVKVSGAFNVNNGNLEVSQ